MFLRVIYIFFNINSLLLFTADWCIIDGCTTVYLSVDEHLSCFQIWAIINEAAVNISYKK